MSIFTSVALGWLGRRILDWGGWIGGVLWVILKLYAELPPPLQDAVGRVLQGNWEELTLGAVIGLGAWAWSQVQSFRATVKPQIVTPTGDKVELEKLDPAEQRDVTVIAKQARPSMTVLDQLMAKLNKGRRR